MEIIRGSFGHHFGVIWGSFGYHLGVIWGSCGRHLGIIRGSIGVHLGVIWGSFGDHLGIIWASFGNDLGVIWASFRVIRAPKNEPKKNRFLEPVKKIVFPVPPKSIFLTGSGRGGGAGEGTFF